MEINKTELMGFLSSKCYKHLQKEATDKYDSYLKKAFNSLNANETKIYLDRAYGVAEVLGIMQLLMLEITNKEKELQGLNDGY